jgi:hypothetical protein
MKRPRSQVKSEPGPPMTLGSAAAAGVRLIVWCWDCLHQVEPDPAEHATRYGPKTTVLDWKARLVCTGRGSRKVDMVVSGTKRRIAKSKKPEPPWPDGSPYVEPIELKLPLW